MNQHHDLPLFDWTPPIKIIPFPLRNRVGHIRRTASNIYNSRTDREAESFLRRAIDGLSRQMTKAGVEEATIEAELRAFHDCVQAEMCRIAKHQGRSGGDVA